MPKRLRKRPTDTNQLAHSILQDIIAKSEEPVKDPIAQELGRRGGKVGGKRRAANMTPEQRSAAARKAAAARWRNQKETPNQ
jgi:hypothetical protein